MTVASEVPEKVEAKPSRGETAPRKRKAEGNVQKPIAKNVTLQCIYDREMKRSKIIATFGDFRWEAGPWGGNYTGQQFYLWNKQRAYFKGENTELRDKLPNIEPPALD